MCCGGVGREKRGGVVGMRRALFVITVQEGWREAGRGKVERGRKRVMWKVDIQGIATVKGEGKSTVRKANND